MSAPRSRINTLLGRHKKSPPPTPPTPTEMQLSGSQLSRRVAALVDFTGAARPTQATERATIANFLSCTLAGDFDTRYACSVLGCL
jgi:hypothetical protein